MEFDCLLDLPYPGAVCWKAPEAIFGNDNDNVPGVCNSVKDGLEIIPGSEAAGVKEHTRFTKATLSQLVFRKFSLYGAALADKNE